jgi:hypothetical protein
MILIVLIVFNNNLHCYILPILEYWQAIGTLCINIYRNNNFESTDPLKSVAFQYIVFVDRTWRWPVDRPKHVVWLE